MNKHKCILLLTCNWCYFIVNAKNTWKLGKQSRKAIVFNTAIATNCTVHLDTKVYSDFTFTEMTVTGYYKTIFISTGTRIWHCDEVWHRRPSRKTTRMSLPMLWSNHTWWCRLPRPMACKQVALERQTLALLRKNTNSKSTKANKETEVTPKEKIAAPNVREKQKCRALTESSYQHQC